MDEQNRTKPQAPELMNGTPADADTDAAHDERVTTFSRRALLEAGWTAPVIIATMLPQNAYALSVGHGDVHVDSHTDVQLARHNDFDPTDIDQSPHTDTAHADAHTDTHTDAPTPTHTDTAHGDGHVDVHNDDAGAQHTDQLHVDVHTDVHTDAIAQPSAPVHIDAHEDSHTDAHVDAHVDHTDAPAHNDTRHHDHSDGSIAGFHFDFACGPAHQDQILPPGGHIDHSDTFHRDHTDGAHVDHYDLASPGPTRTVSCSPSFMDHTDRPVHTDTHADFSHNDRPHSDTSHGDSHDDAHRDIAHRDVHVDG